MFTSTLRRLLPAIMGAVVAVVAPTTPVEAQSSPGLVPPTEGSEWTYDRSLERVLGQLRVRSTFGGGYPPQQRCAMATVTSEGEILGYGVSPEPVNIEDGMSGAQACGPALEALPGDMLIPGERFVEGDVIIPGHLPLLADLFFDEGSEMDGFYLADEISSWATSMVRKDSGDAHQPRVVESPSGPWFTFLVFFIPAEGVSDDYQGQALVIDLNPERMGR